MHSRPKRLSEERTEGEENGRNCQPKSSTPVLWAPRNVPYEKQIVVKAIWSSLQARAHHVRCSVFRTGIPQNLLGIEDVQGVDVGGG